MARDIEMRIFRLRNGQCDGALVRRTPRGYRAGVHSIDEEVIFETGGRIGETDAMFRCVNFAFEEGYEIVQVTFLDGGNGCSGQADYGRLYGDN